LIKDVFPPEVAKGLAAANLHPDDVRDMALDYQAAMAQPVGKDPSKFAAKMAGSYETDPSKVPPPKFDDGMSDQEKAEAYRKNQLSVVGASIAAKQKLTEELMMPTITNKARLPEGLASNRANVMLTSPSKEQVDKLRKEAAGGAKQAQQALDDYDETIASVVEGTMAGVMETGGIPVKNSVARGLMRNLGDNPGAQEIARSFFEANDYHEAKDKFLGEGQITEHSSPRQILAGLDKADKWFAKKGEAYGGYDHRMASTFKDRVLNKLAALQPEKYYEVRDKVDKRAVKDFDKQQAKYEKAHKAWTEKKRKVEEGSSFGGYGVVAPGAKPADFSEPEPVAPKKPVRYGMGQEPGALKSMGRKLFKKLFDGTKTATAHYVSTYPERSTMGKSNTKTGVYHGIDPAENDPGPYPDHDPPAVVGPDECETILTVARDWLKDPSMNEEEGDQRYRSALDLAIKSTGHDKHMSPPVYAELLAQLQGRVVQAADSSCTPSPSSKVDPMKASHEIRKMAAKTANTNPKLAFELTDLADRVVDEAKFAKIRSLLIRTAASDAGAKKVLMPILQALKAMD
jgi:hypothetical protein